MEKPSCEEGADPTTENLPRRSGLPRQRMLHPSLSKKTSRVRRGVGRTQQKTTLGFALGKKPSPR